MGAPLGNCNACKKHRYSLQLHGKGFYVRDRTGYYAKRGSTKSSPYILAATSKYFKSLAGAKRYLNKKTPYR